MKRYLLPLLLTAAVALGQSSPDKGKAAVTTPPPSLSTPLRAPQMAQAEPLPPGIIVSDTIYPLPHDEREKVRDLQLEWDELEIDNQKMLLKVEQNKQRQAAAMDAIKLSAYQFAQAKHIDLTIYELDSKDLKFVVKKKKDSK